MSHQSFWDALHAAQVRMRAREAADGDLADERDDDLGDELADREAWCAICEERHMPCDDPLRVWLP